MSDDLDFDFDDADWESDGYEQEEVIADVKKEIVEEETAKFEEEEEPTIYFTGENAKENHILKRMSKYELLCYKNARDRLNFYRQQDLLEMTALHKLEEELGITASVASMSGQLKVNGSVDLNKLVAQAPNAELDKRKRPNVHIRLKNPRCSVQVNPSGFISILGAKSRSDLYLAARTVAYLVKSSGAYPQAKIKEFLINNIVISCHTKKERKSSKVVMQLQEIGYHATLDQEIFPCVRVVLKHPHEHSCKVFRTGALIFMGLKNITNCIHSIKYFVNQLENLPEIKMVTQTRFGNFVARGVSQKEKEVEDIPETFAPENPDELEELDFTVDHIDH